MYVSTNNIILSQEPPPDLRYHLDKQAQILILSSSSLLYLYIFELNQTRGYKSPDVFSFVSCQPIQYKALDFVIMGCEKPDAIQGRYEVWVILLPPAHYIFFFEAVSYCVEMKDWIQKVSFPRPGSLIIILYVSSFSIPYLLQNHSELSVPIQDWSLGCYIYRTVPMADRDIPSLYLPSCSTSSGCTATDRIK